MQFVSIKLSQKCSNIAGRSVSTSRQADYLHCDQRGTAKETKSILISLMYPESECLAVESKLQQEDAQYTTQSVYKPCSFIIQNTSNSP